MFAHQVIGYAPIIKTAVKYHMGDIKDFQHLLKDGKFLFMDRDLRIPHKVMWVDYRCHREFVDVEYIVDKVGVLLVGVFDTVMVCSIFTHFKQVDRWVPPVLTYIVLLGGRTPETMAKYYVVAKELRLNVELGDEGNIIAFGGGKEDIATIADYDNVDLNTIDTTLRLLTCKNIQEVTERAPKALNKKRAKSGKIPLYDYKVLTVLTPRQVKRYAEGRTNGAPQYTVVAHLCEGHFRVYTPEKPLFGKWSGRYWWQPQVRGDRSKGFLHKGYNVKQNGT